MSSAGTVRPGHNEPNLRYVAERYSNVAIAQAVDVSEAAVRKWLKRWGIKRTRRVFSGDLDELAVSDIRDHLLCGSISRGPENYLFTNHAGRLRDPDHVGNVFRRLMKQSGLKPIRFHDLRHSFGTVWAERVPSSVLKMWMGHSSLVTTENYLHPNDDTSKRVLGNALELMSRKEARKSSR